MAQVSKRPLKKETLNLIWDRLVTAMGGKDKESTEIILAKLLTTTEKIMFSKRLMMDILLLSDWNPYDVAEVLHVSTNTVYKHKFRLDINPEYQKRIQKIFPEKIPFPGSSRGKSGLEKFIDDFFALRHQRSRGYYPLD